MTWGHSDKAVLPCVCTWRHDAHEENQPDAHAHRRHSTWEASQNQP